MQPAAAVPAEKRSSQAHRGKNGRNGGGGNQKQSRPVLLRPAVKGERTCLCSGTLQECKGHYGWIIPDKKIDHAEAKKHRGGVYLDTRDIRPGAPLRKGDEVSFYLFADATGLGAEDCRLKNADAERPAAKPELWQLLHPRAPAEPQCASSSGAAELKGDCIAARLSHCKVGNEVDDCSDDCASTTLGSRSSSDDCSSGSCSSQSSPGCVSVEPEFLSGADSPTDLMATLRAELQMARALAERSRSSRKSSAAEQAPGTVQLPPGFSPPPGLCLPTPETRSKKADTIPQLTSSLPSQIDLPPGLSGLLAELQAPPGLLQSFN